MKVFLSHAEKDRELAQQLAAELDGEGFDVWNPEAEIAPGDNSAKKIGKALDQSDLLVVLLTPKAMESISLRRDVEFAISSKKYENRLFTVFVGPTYEAGKDMPWILIRLPNRQLESAAQLNQAARQIRRTFNGHGARPSHAHA